MTTVEIRHFHLFAGLGGGARGFNRGEARVGKLIAKFRCLGGIDVDASAMRDFERLAGVRGTALDLFDRAQYVAFHGKEPPAGWREASIDDVRRAAGNERPHIVFLSAPCKGFSGLLSETLSKSGKYQALNRLTERGVLLMLEAWAHDPPELVLFENVPRIAQRGRQLLERITAMLRHYGYAVAETTHDCGELGGLAQSRKRFLLVARHMAKVPPFLYQPERRSLQAVGSVLGRMLMPGDSRGGPMHRLPALQWKTWVRLAFVEAGSDWRSLNRLAVEGGFLRDFAIAPDVGYWERSAYGVTPWSEPAGTVTGNGRPGSGAFSVADPRFDQSIRWHDGQAYGVRRWDQASGTIAGQQTPGQGAYAIADPRLQGSPRFNNAFRIVRWADFSLAVAGPGGAAGGLAVADPRAQSGYHGKGKYIVTPFEAPANTVIAGSTTGNGAFAVADPRAPATNDRRALQRYGVLPWDRPANVVVGNARHDNGFNNVADPRLPALEERLHAVIRALDGTWHRPFTTLELAALQSLMDPEEQLELDGLSDSAWRERIGNAVPSDAAKAIADEMARTLLLAWSGETFQLSATPVWVRPMAIALVVAR